MIGGSSFSIGTCNNLNISLLIEGILYIFITGTVIFNFPNMVATSMFNWISYFVVFGFGINSCTRGGSGGTTFSVYGGGVVASGWGGAKGCDSGTQNLFLLMYVKNSIFLSLSDHLSTSLKPKVFPLFPPFFWPHQSVPVWPLPLGSYRSYPWNSYFWKNLHLVGDTHLIYEDLGMEDTKVFVLCQPFKLVSVKILVCSLNHRQCHIIFT